MFILVLSSLQVTASPYVPLGNGFSNLSCGSTSSTLNVYVPIYGQTNGSSQRIDAWFTHEGNDVYLLDGNATVTLDYFNGTSNVTFNFTHRTGGRWDIYLTSAEEEDFNFTINAGGNEGTNFSYECLMEAGLMMFRLPFVLTIELYHSNVSGFAEPYLNDFQYMFLTNYSMKYDERWARQQYSLSWVDNLFRSWWPFYKNDKFDAAPVDQITSFWSPLSSGVATVRLYEAGNYSINLIKTKVMGLGWGYEFVYPQYDKAQTYSQIEYRLPITNESNANLKIFVDAWEVDKTTVIMNWVKYTFLAIVWIGVGIGLAFISPQIAAVWFAAFWFIVQIVSKMG